MKKVLLSLALVSISMAFAQKKEIQNAVKAVDGGNNTEALAQVSAAENTLQGKLYLLEPSVLEQYYYAKGLALLKSGKIAEGANVLAKISDLGKTKFYVGKDNEKNKVYFAGKEEADKLGTGLKLKEESFTPSLNANLGNIVNPMLSKISNEAQDAYNAKKYNEAAASFLKVNDLLRAVGQPDQTYEYYAAISYALANNKEEAIKVYQDLINSGYTGVKTTYSALNKKTNARENFDKNTFDLVKKSPDYADFKTETSKSVEEELYDTAASLMIDAEKYDLAIQTLEKAIAKFPNNTRFGDLKLSAYSRSGNSAKLEDTIKEALAKNPSDKMNWSNLGIIKSSNQTPENVKQAEEAFSKALALDANYIPALRGICFNLYLNADEDKKLIDSYNEARKAGKIDEANKIIAGRKVKFEKALPYLERLYAADPKDIDTVSTLANVYASLGKADKSKELKAVLKKLEASK
ncbi:lipopolysaccharide assembly protein LapB [Elizabethkingia sp. JS20170427COW]|uniref:tetratricopeptide repeat protein n=1 Tax=Elizabethkingia sp. JS20170427COW TaxID=2583851 RepID=UPI001110157F|nr:tetratricopeptide repeat protein [Elizabethkingia sp. JS20170427COW]QCX53990.1 tetratricopeptide repeat protein [Elizabethkingia sp. JS20170427COW]